MPERPRYNWGKDVKPLLEKVATLCLSDEKKSRDGVLNEAFYSYTAKNTVKNRKPTKVIQVNYILDDPGESKYPDGYIYLNDLEKIAMKYSIDFSEIIERGF